MMANARRADHLICPKNAAALSNNTLSRTSSLYPSLTQIGDDCFKTQDRKIAAEHDAILQTAANLLLQRRRKVFGDQPWSS